MPAALANVGWTRNTPSVGDAAEVSGYNVIDSLKQPDAGVSFLMRKPFTERKTPEAQLRAIINALQARLVLPQLRTDVRIKVAVYKNPAAPQMKAFSV